MEQKTKKVRIIALEDMGMVMREVSKEVKPLLNKVVTHEEQEAANTLFGTLAALTLNIFNYLPAEQQDEILVNCGTWFDIGVLLGKSPQLLLGILERVNPTVGDTEVPDWLADKLIRAPE